MFLNLGSTPTSMEEVRNAPFGCLTPIWCICTVWVSDTDMVH